MITQIYISSLKLLGETLHIRLFQEKLITCSPLGTMCQIYVSMDELNGHLSMCEIDTG